MKEMLFNMYVVENENCEPLYLYSLRVFKTHGSCCFQGKEKLESLMLLMIIVRDKYFLYLINDMISVMGPLINLLHIYG